MDASQKFYGVTSAAKVLGISKRSVQRRCERYNVLKVGNRYRISKDLIREWAEQIALEHQEKLQEKERAHIEERIRQNQTESDEVANGRNEDEPEVFTAEFTPEEYAEAMKRIGEYPQLIERLKDYRGEIEYLRKSLDEKAVQMEKAFETMQKSLENVFAALDNQKRDQYLKYQEKSNKTID